MKKINLLITVLVLSVLILAGAGCKKTADENDTSSGGKTKNEATKQYDSKKTVCETALNEAIERNEIYFKNVQNVADQNKNICKSSCDTSKGAGGTAECWQSCIDKWESDLSVINARKIQTDEEYYKCLEKK